MLRILAERGRRIILQLVTFSVIKTQSDLRAAACKSRRNIDGWNRIVADLIAVFDFILKARFVDRFRINNHRFGQSKFVFGSFGVESSRRERCFANSLILNPVARITITCDERIILIYLIIETRADGKTAIRNLKFLVKIDNIQGRIQNKRIDDGIAVFFTIADVEEKRRFPFLNRTGNISAVKSSLTRRTVESERIA